MVSSLLLYNRNVPEQVNLVQVIWSCSCNSIACCIHDRHIAGAHAAVSGIQALPATSKLVLRKSGLKSYPGSGCCSRCSTHFCKDVAETRTDLPKRTTGNPSLAISSYTLLRPSPSVAATSGMLNNSGGAEVRVRSSVVSFLFIPAVPLY
jgi:hypothetical protein